MMYIMPLTQNAYHQHHRHRHHHQQAFAARTREDLMEMPLMWPTPRDSSKDQVKLEVLFKIGVVT